MEQLTTPNQLHSETGGPANTDTGGPADTETGNTGGAATARHHHRQVESLKGKVKGLERELYYYKKTSRDLKKKLQVLRKESTASNSETCNTHFPSTNIPNEASTYQSHCTSILREEAANTAKREEKAECTESATSSEPPLEGLAKKPETHQTETVLLSSPMKPTGNEENKGMQLNDSLECRRSQVAGEEQQQTSAVLKNKKQLRQLRSASVCVCVCGCDFYSCFAHTVPLKWLREEANTNSHPQLKCKTYKTHKLCV